MSEDILTQLQEPFDPDDIEWRIQSSGVAGKPWAIIIPYVDNRAVQRRLDDVFGVFGWEDEYKPTCDGRGMLCGITVYDPKSARKVTKWDGAETPREFSDAELKDGKKHNSDPVKTALSNSEKRASVKLGVGRYLYRMKAQFAICKVLEKRSNCSDNGNYHKIKKGGATIHVEWIPPRLPSWAMPHIKSDDLIQAIREAENVIDLRVAFGDAYNYALSFNRSDLIDEMKKIKDEKKRLLEEKSETESEKDEKKHRVWFELKAIEVISKANNESVLKIQYKAFKTEVIEESNNKGIDPKPLLESLSRYYREQLNKLAIL